MVLVVKIRLFILFESGNKAHKHTHTHTHTQTVRNVMKMSKAYDIKILWTYTTMLLEVFSQVRIKIALQLCNTVVKLGNLRLNKIFIPDPVLLDI